MDAGGEPTLSAKGSRWPASSSSGPFPTAIPSARVRSRGGPARAPCRRIIAPCGDSLPRAIALLRQMPCAQLGARNRSFDVPTMTLDDRPGAALAVSRPVQLGHRRMAFLGGAGGIGSHGSSTGRGHSPLRADTGRGTGCASGRPSGAGTAVDHGFRRSGPVPLRGTRRDRHRLANRQACPGGRAASVRARPSGRRFQTSRPLHRNPRRSA